MLRVMIVLTLFLSMVTQAETSLPTVDSFYKESDALLGKSKTSAEKMKNLKTFHQSLKATIDLYEKKNPKKGTPEEDKISLFYFTLAPVVTLSETTKIDSKSCSQIENQVQSGALENSKPTPAREHSMKWLRALCPEL